MVKKGITEAEFNELIRPQLRLFMSIDLEGSTRAKQVSAKTGKNTWLPQLTTFLTDFEADYFFRVLKTDFPAIKEPICWKTLGDELLYQVEINQRGQVVPYIKALCNAVAEWNSDSKAKNISRLKVKGAAWLAGFPVSNTLLPLANGLDFVGPAIDLGFRLSKYSSPKQLSVSVDLLCLLREEKFDGNIFFQGRKETKGILDGNGYPVFTIEILSSDLDKAENHLLGKKSLKADEVADFCRQFISETEIPNFPPFLPCEMKTYPQREKYEQEREKVVANLTDIFKPIPAQVSEQSTPDNSQKAIEKAFEEALNSFLKSITPK